MPLRAINRNLKRIDFERATSVLYVTCHFDDVVSWSTQKIGSVLELGEFTYASKKADDERPKTFSQLLDLLAH